MSKVAWSGGPSGSEPALPRRSVLNITLKPGRYNASSAFVRALGNLVKCEVHFGARTLPHMKIGHCENCKLGPIKTIGYLPIRLRNVAFELPDPRRWAEERVLSVAGLNLVDFEGEIEGWGLELKALLPTAEKPVGVTRYTEQQQRVWLSLPTMPWFNVQEVMERSWGITSPVLDECPIDDARRRQREFEEQIARDQAETARRQRLQNPGLFDGPTGDQP